MAIDREDGGDPLAELPALGGALRPPSPDETRGLLAIRLVPTVDKIRELNARFGIRPYRVFLVHALWTGGERGVGDQMITSRIELTPIPFVEDLGGVSQVLRDTGMTEEGDVRVSEISARYTEDDLLGRTPDLRDPAIQRSTNAAADFWWEFVENRPSTPTPAVRRFFPVGVPELIRDECQWKVSLTKQDQDRGRAGEPSGMGSF